MRELLKAWSTAHRGTPPEVAKTIEKCSEPIKKYLGTVLGQLSEQQLISDVDLNAVAEQAMEWFWQWALISFAIGLEDGLGNIPKDDVPLYLFACNQPYQLYLLGLPGLLLNRGKASERYVTDLGGELGDFFSEFSVFLDNQGWIFHADVQAQYEAGNSPVGRLLRTIDLESIRELMAQADRR